MGYLHNVKGHAFVGGEINILRPSSPISYELELKDGGTWTVTANFPISIRVTGIVGKMRNPFVGYYFKAGGEWTYIQLKYAIENENPPFEKEKGNPAKDFITSGSEAFSAHLKAGFLGVGVIFFSKSWTYSLEYNASIIKNEEIRDFKKAEPRKRGYIYGGTHHRVMLRIAYMFS